MWPGSADNSNTTSNPTIALLVRRDDGELAVVSRPEGQPVATLWAPAASRGADLMTLTVDGMETVRIDGTPVVKAIVGAPVHVEVGDQRSVFQLVPPSVDGRSPSAPPAATPPPVVAPAPSPASTPSSTPSASPTGSTDVPSARASAAPTSMPSLLPDARSYQQPAPHSTGNRPPGTGAPTQTGWPSTAAGSTGPRVTPAGYLPSALPPSATQQRGSGSQPYTPVGAAAASPQTSGTTSLDVHHLTVVTKDITRLDGIDFKMRSGSFLSVLGTSGAGKSTLVKALTGVDPATDGFVVFDGVDMYQQFEHVRSRIGYVPQDDILHQQLTVRETLEYAARLRFPPSTTDAARLARIDAVIGELSLTPRADARVDELSGGQRKRVNVAVELLTEPSLLILDEPTSGLDPGNERLMMELLRNLADGGRMVIAVTHSMESLHLCDDVLFLAPGGVPVYLGPPDDLPRTLGASNYTEVFTAVERMTNASAVRVPRAGAVARPTITPAAEPPHSGTYVDELGRQFRILVERYVRVITSDRRNLLILALQAPVIGIVMLAVFGSGHLGGDAGPNAGNVLMGMSLATVYLGASNAVREIVKERSILRREQNFGLSIVAYLGSKFAVLGVITTAQAGVLVAAGLARQSGPDSSLVLGQAHIELLALIVVCGLSALALGLLISAWSSSADKAMTMLPVLLFMQFLLAGLIFPVSAIGVQQASWVMSTRWGFAGAATTADFWNLRACDVPDAECSELWKHSGGLWLLSYTMLCVLTGLALYGAWRLISRQDPVNILARASATAAA